MIKLAFKHLLVLLAMVGLMVISSASTSLAFNPVSIGSTELRAIGFLRNNYGYFLEDQDYANNDDSKLATNRTWLRVETDYRMSDSLSLFAAGQLVYEPEYDIEEGSVSEEDGKEYSEYDDLDDTLREFYFDWRPSKNSSFRVGRQIVIWGESTSQPVGDIINPVDGRYTLNFANQEDTRIPQWMVKGIHDFDNTATSVEWLVSPLLTGEEHRVNRSGEMAQLGAGEFVGQRFGIHPEDRFLPPYAVGNPALGLPVAANPTSRGWIYNPFAPGTGWVPTEIPDVIHEYPEDGMEDARYGFRTSTFRGGYEFGISYFHTQEYTPVVKRSNETRPSGLPAPAPATIRKYYVVHPDVDYLGAYFNVDMPVGLLRAEAIYAPNKSFKTFDLSDSDAITETDYFKYLIALDFKGMLYFDWHKSAPIDITIEHIAEYIPDNENLQRAAYGEEVAQYNPSIGVNMYTSWFYGLLETRLIAAYATNNNSGMIMPIVTWKPSWKDKAFSAELRYINLYGDDDYENLGGMWRKKDMIILTTQYNF